jgi:hypothetical protein
VNRPLAEEPGGCFRFRRLDGTHERSRLADVLARPGASTSLVHRNLPGTLGRLGARVRHHLRDPAASSVGGDRNVLTWLMFGLAVWLSVGALAAQLFGALILDDEDLDASR